MRCPRRRKVICEHSQSDVRKPAQLDRIACARKTSFPLGRTPDCVLAQLTGGDTEKLPGPDGGKTPH